MRIEIQFTSRYGLPIFHFTFGSKSFFLLNKFKFYEKSPFRILLAVLHQHLYYVIDEGFLFLRKMHKTLAWILCRKYVDVCGIECKEKRKGKRKRKKMVKDLPNFLISLFFLVAVVHNPIAMYVVKLWNWTTEYNNNTKSFINCCCVYCLLFRAKHSISKKNHKFGKA